MAEAEQPFFNFPLLVLPDTRHTWRIGILGSEITQKTRTAGQGLAALR
jgi:hypothetical protein